jgi:hypothetical protein
VEKVNTKTNEEKSIPKFLHSSDPLSDQAANYLLNFREEDVLVDFKLTFNFGNEKDWLELTKDVMAFANAQGGYIVFGVQNETFEPIGLDKAVVTELTDTNKLMQKINRFLEPEISTLRSKSFVRENEYYVILFIPESIGITHMISKDGFFNLPSGEKKTVLRQGTFHLRRSAGNHLADSRDLENVFNKRLDLFKESILGKIARVVEAPQTSEVFILSKDPTDEAGKKFIIDNAPDAIPVKGMSFSVSPQTPEQEVAAWIAMWIKDPAAIPRSETLWRWYKQRRSLKLTENQRIMVAEFSMLASVPFFFWLRGIPNENINRMLLDAVTRQTTPECVECALGTAAFLGKKVYKTIFERLSNRKRLAPKFKRFPQPSPRQMFHAGVVEGRRFPHRKKMPESEFRANLEKELDFIAASVNTHKKRQPGVMERMEALAMDCYLYAQDDQYTGSKAQP